MNYDNRTLGRYAAPARAQSISYQQSGVEVVMWDGAGLSVVNTNNLKSLGSGYLPSLSGSSSGTLSQSEQSYALAYMTCVWVFRAMNVRAEKTADVLRQGQVIDTETGKALPNHPLIRAFDLAFQHYQQDTFLYWAFSRGIYGEAYIEKVKAYPFGLDTLGIPSAVRALNALAIEPVVINGKVTRYDYFGEDNHVQFKPDEIVFDKTFNPGDDFRGLSLLASALNAVEIDRSLLLVDKAFLKNNMRPGVVFVPKSNTLLDVDEKRLKTTIQERGKGVENAGRPLLLPVAMDITTVEQPKFEDKHILSEDQKHRIAAAIGVPVGIVDFRDTAFQLSPQQMFSLYNLTIIPDAQKIARVVKAQLLPFFDRSGKTTFEIPVDRIMSELADPAARAQVAGEHLRSGGITVNEYRQEIGKDPIDTGDVLMLPAGVLIVPPAQLGTQIAPPTLAVPTPAINAVAPPVVPEAPVGKSLCVMLDLANNPDLVALQGRLKTLYAEQEVTWNTSDSFHVTVLYAPTVTDEQQATILTALEELDAPELALRVGSLKVFDSVGEYALHFRVRRNVDLEEFQQDVFDLFEANGIPTSSYSRPEAYIPHITMGYAAQKQRAVTFQSNLKVKVQGVYCTAGDDEIYRRAVGDEPEQPAQKAVPTLPELDWFGELEAWQKKVKNKGVGAEFQTYAIRDEESDSIRAALQVAPDKAAVKGVFHAALERLTVKAIGSTRLDFENAFADVLTEALAGNLTRRRWSTITRNLIQVYGNKAFRDGLKEAGVDDEPDEAEQDTIAALIREQAQYVTGLGEKLFKTEDAVSEAMAEQKPALWWNGSIAKFYSEGLLAGNGNAMYTWVLGKAEEHCPDCPRLNGQRRRYKTWYRQNLIAGTVGQSTTCGGWECDCKLKRAAGKSTTLPLEVEEHEHV